MNVEHLGGRFLDVLIACSTDEAYFDQVIGKTYDDLLVAVREKRSANEPQFRAEFADGLTLLTAASVVVTEMS